MTNILRRGQRPPSGSTRPKLYYGWVIVGVMILIGLVQTGQFNPTIGVFIKPITEQYGWTRTQFTGAVTIGTLMASLASFFIGPALDRYGPKWVVCGGLLIIAGSAIGMAFVSGLWQLYLCIIAGRVAVQSAINLAMTVTVPKWFVRRRGRAVSIAGLGNRLGTGFTPMYAQAFVSGFGWRVATFALGLLTLGVALLPSFFLLKRQPEDMGLHPDGDSLEETQAVKHVGEPKQAASTKQEDVASYTTEINFTLKQALRTRTFYLLSAVIILMMMVAPGLNLHLLPYLTDQGLSAGVAAAVVTTSALSSAVGGFVTGYFTERFSIRYTFAACFVFAAGTIGLLMNVHTAATAFTWALFFGFFFGAMVTLFYLMLPDYFGRNSLGAIRGVTTPLQLGANALSPLFAALVFDATGAYTLIFWVFIACYLTAALILMVTRPPKRPAGA